MWLNFMKELQEILEKISESAPDEKAILATVVDVVGSGYRRPGARMLINRNGYGIGTVSGGCLEADVLERAKKVLQTNEPTVITYDTSKDENSVFGLGMGCRGIVRILLEPIGKESDFLEFVSLSLKRRTSFKVVTLINPKKPGLKIGSRVILDDSNLFGLNLSFDEISEVKNLPEKGSFVSELSFGEVFVETIKPPLNLLLFGAGYDALPLIKFAKELGWRVTAIDHRPAFANKERLSEADEILVKNIEDFDDNFFQDENSAAVIMTHNYNRDRDILPRLLKSKYLYVGALGPKKRTEKILAETNGNWTENLHAPIGLDIGADTPEAIALAIIAEIQAVLKSRNGGFLRERQGSIYGRN
jgi:xanthine/CO dehydrogenase XdhC/CoxF family maturation factor